MEPQAPFIWWPTYDKAHVPFDQGLKLLLLEDVHRDVLILR